LLNVPKITEINKEPFKENLKNAFEKKEQYAKHAYEKNLSVRQFKEYIKEQNPSKAIDLTALPSKVELRKRTQDELVAGVSLPHPHPSWSNISFNPCSYIILPFRLF